MKSMGFIVMQTCAHFTDEKTETTFVIKTPVDNHSPGAWPDVTLISLSPFHLPSFLPSTFSNQGLSSFLYVDSGDQRTGSFHPSDSQGRGSQLFFFRFLLL